MARPEVFMVTPNNDIITFDTVDQAAEWIGRQLASMIYTPEVATDG